MAVFTGARTDRRWIRKDQRENMKKRRFLQGLAISAAAVFLLAGCYHPTSEEPVVPTVTSAAETTAAPTTTAEPLTEEPVSEDAVTEEPVSEEDTSEEETSASESTEESGATMDVGQHWYVSTDTLNVRSTPSTDGEVVARIYRSFEVLILETNPEIDPWVRVSFQNDDGTAGEGYVNSAYLANTLSKSRADGSSAADEAAATTAAAVASAAVTTAAPASNANGHIVCLDAGHQAHGISDTEPNGPGSTVMKAKLTTGTSGVATGVAERDLNLAISLQLQTELTNRGYQVVMIRTTNDCPLSNAERAQVANSSGAEIFVRIHANSSNDPTVSGAQFYAPSPANPYMSADLIAASNTLANTMLTSYCAATGFTNRGMLQDDTMTGINWCQIPVTIAEMGFMSNPTEDQAMEDPAVQALMVQGLANGIDSYFGL